MSTIESVAADCAAKRVLAGPARNSWSHSPLWYVPQCVIRRDKEVVVIGKPVDGIHGEVIERTRDEYWKERAHPYQQTGFFDFAPEDPEGLWQIEAYVRRSPRSAAQELFRLRQASDRRCTGSDRSVGKDVGKMVVRENGEVTQVVDLVARPTGLEPVTF